MNKFGLKRHIPADVARFVRQRDGFGCVVCGSAFYQYDHFDVEFAEAKQHDPDDIFLLCAADHDRKTKGFLSKETIRRHIANPKAKDIGFSFGPFDIGVQPPTVFLGDLKITNVATIIEVLGEPVFSVKPPEAENTPFRINACLRDAKGSIVLEIVDNEWRTRAENWDATVEGRNITIRSAHRQIALSLRSQPPHGLVVERMDMTHRGHRIQCVEGGELTIESNGAKIEAQGGEISDGDAAIVFDGRGILIGRFASVRTGNMVINRSGSQSRSPKRPWRATQPPLKQGPLARNETSDWIPLSQVSAWLLHQTRQGGQL